ncbi:uncharacterized protein LOC101004413 [Papio anubis]|uniref:uncharacterized protein LOC101004413 n=1 Tax=Papio anubis TaxID=9555 RepID=UPI00027F2E22|nr:uncharacterized protein LOC101004413 [Papio anubis]
MEVGRNWGGGAGQGGLRPSPLKSARPRASLRSPARLAGEAPRTGGEAALNRNDLVWSGLAPSLLPRPLLSLSFSDGLVFAAVPDQENPSRGQLSPRTTTEVGSGPKDRCHLKQATVVRLQYAGRTSSRSTLLPLGGRLTPAWECDCGKASLLQL